MFYEGVKPVGVEEGNEKSIVNELISVAILLSLEGTLISRECAHPKKRYSTCRCEVVWSLSQKPRQSLHH